MNINLIIKKVKITSNINKYFSLKDLNKILKFMIKDKKNNSDKINLILLKKIGQPIINNQYRLKMINFLKQELIIKICKE